mmetsp:Transcript_9126/g.21483  ORF Transcript_9126/g.21483 Transcript_9126/m.21483 type:complete len:156 (-) Transcript_9126:242-709(-)
MSMIFPFWSVALVPQNLAPQRHCVAPRAASGAPQMIFGLGGKQEEVRDITLDRPQEVLVATPEPGYENPAKVQLSEVELAERKTKLEALSAKWSKRQQQLEWDAELNVGWVFKAETINGRLAMFFLLTGLITEYYTGESIPQQTLTMLQTLGFVD